MLFFFLWFIGEEPTATIRYNVVLSQLWQGETNRRLNPLRPVDAPNTRGRGRETPPPPPWPTFCIVYCCCCGRFLLLVVFVFCSRFATTDQHWCGNTYEYIYICINYKKPRCSSFSTVSFHIHGANSVDPITKTFTLVHSLEVRFFLPWLPSLTFFRFSSVMMKSGTCSTAVSAVRKKWWKGLPKWQQQKEMKLSWTASSFMILSHAKK